MAVIIRTSTRKLSIFSLSAPLNTETALLRPTKRETCDHDIGDSPMRIRPMIPIRKKRAVVVGGKTSVAAVQQQSCGAAAGRASRSAFLPGALPPSCQVGLFHQDLASPTVLGDLPGQAACSAGAQHDMSTTHHDMNHRCEALSSMMSDSLS